MLAQSNLLCMKKQQQILCKNNLFKATQSLSWSTLKLPVKQRETMTSAWRLTSLTNGKLGLSISLALIRQSCAAQWIDSGSSSGSSEHLNEGWGPVFDEDERLQEQMHDSKWQSRQWKVSRPEDCKSAILESKSCRLEGCIRRFFHGERDPSLARPRYAALFALLLDTGTFALFLLC